VKSYICNVYKVCYLTNVLYCLQNALTVADWVGIYGFWGLCSHISTGVLLLDPAGGLRSPDPLCLSKSWLHHCHRVLTRQCMFLLQVPEVHLATLVLPDLQDCPDHGVFMDPTVLLVRLVFLDQRILITMDRKDHLAPLELVASQVPEVDITVTIVLLSLRTTRTSSSGTHSQGSLKVL